MQKRHDSGGRGSISARSQKEGVLREGGPDLGVGYQLGGVMVYHTLKEE